MSYRAHRKTRTADVYNWEDTISIVRIFPDAKQTVDDASANVQAAKDLINRSPSPILVDIRKAKRISPEVRRFYSGDNLDCFSSMALLVNASPLGKMMGNIYMNIAPLTIPTKLFTREQPAIKWLMKFPKK